MTRVPGGLIEGNSSAAVSGTAARRGPSEAGGIVNPALTGANLGNVVVFRPRQATSEPAAAVSVDAAARPAPLTVALQHPAWAVAFAAGSAVLHAGLLLLFLQQPRPLASLGVESISVEIVLGATTPAGVAPTPGENEVQAAESKGLRTAEAPLERDEAATVQPHEVPVAEQDATPEPTERKVVQAEQAEPAAAREPDPAPPAAAVVPEPQPEPSPPVVAATPPKTPAEKPTAKKETPPAERNTRVAARTSDTPSTGRQSHASVPQTASRGVGVGRSDNDSNYFGRVAAHLARFKQYPDEARRAGQQGAATVSFGLDSGGRVTSVQLVRASGVGSIDREVQAMVRRASPFPAPPSGRPVSFTRQIDFNLK
jgi:protein TonB